MRNKRPVYREVLQDAFRITMSNKHLWPLGFFAAMLLSGSPYDILFHSWTTIVEGPSVAYGSGVGASLLLALVRMKDVGFGGLGFGALVMLLLTLTVAAALAWVSVVSQGALLTSVTAAEDKKRPDMRAAFEGGMRRFWPLLWVNVIMRAAVVAAAAALAMLVVPASRGGSQVMAIATVIGFLVLLPLAYVAINVAFFAEMAVVKHKRGLADALRDAWQLVTRHWLLVLETSALVLAVDVGVAVAAAIVGTLVSIPFFVLFLGAMAVKSLAAYWVVMTVYLLLLAGMILVAASATVTFHYAVWALLAERIRKDDVAAKVMRLYHSIKERIRRK